MVTRRDDATHGPTGRDVALLKLLTTPRFKVPQQSALRKQGVFSQTPERGNRKGWVLSARIWSMLHVDSER